MALLRFLHTADLHLGSPFRLPHDGPLPAPFGDATFRAFKKVVSLAIAEKVDAVLLAGDLFNTADRSIGARLQLGQGLKRLHDAGIRSFLVHGNHDPLSMDPGGLTLPGLATVFGGSHQEVSVSDEQGRVRYRVQGISFLKSDVRDDLSASFSRQGPEVTVGLMHGNLGGHPGHDAYAPCTREGLSRAGLDYWALGHVHEAAVVDLDGGALAVYPGNPQGRHLKETGERFVALVEIDDGADRRPRVRLVPVDAVRWLRVTVAIDGLTGIDELVERFVEKAAQLELQGVEGAVLQLDVEGRGALHAQLLSAFSRDELFSSLRERLQSPTLMLAGLSVDTSPQVSLDEHLAEGGLLGELARVAVGEPKVTAELLGSDEELLALQRALAAAGLPPLDTAALHRDGLTLAISLLQGAPR